jgi:hypothetical protein
MHGIVKNKTKISATVKLISFNEMSPFIKYQLQWMKKQIIFQEVMVTEEKQGLILESVVKL